MILAFFRSTYYFQINWKKLNRCYEFIKVEEFTFENKLISFKHIFIIFSEHLFTCKVLKL